MGFIKAFTDSLGATFADQWKDYIMPVSGITSTVAVFPGVAVGQNSGRGENTKGSTAVISNGSKILVPEGTALITMQDGGITGCIMEPGGYTYSSDDVNSKSFFGGDNIFTTVIQQTWERFKTGGQPAANQQVIYVNMKEIPNNKFGTPSPINWFDKYLNTKAAAMARGIYSLRIIDPILFVKQFVPANYLLANKVFDFGDMNNPSGEQIFTEFLTALPAAFTRFSSESPEGTSIEKMQTDQVGIARILSEEVEQVFNWKTDRGLVIERVAIAAIEYDELTLKTLEDVRKADSLMGARGNSFMQQSVARGFEAAGSNPNSGGAMGMGFMGMGMNATGGAMGAFQQPVQQPAQQQPQASQQDDPMVKLEKLKALLDKGLITQEDYDKTKNEILGKI